MHNRLDPVSPRKLRIQLQGLRTVGECGSEVSKFQSHLGAMGPCCRLIVTQIQMTGQIRFNVPKPLLFISASRTRLLTQQCSPCVKFQMIGVQLDTSIQISLRARKVVFSPTSQRSHQMQLGRHRLLLDRFPQLLFRFIPSRQIDVNGSQPQTSFKRVWIEFQCPFKISQPLSKFIVSTTGIATAA